MLDLLAPDDIAAADGRIPIDDYTLKIYGTDEQLDGNTLLGHHLCVGAAVVADKDVMLEVGRRTLAIVNTSVPMSPRFVFVVTCRLCKRTACRPTSDVSAAALNVDNFVSHCNLKPST